MYIHTRYANKTAMLGMLDRESRQVRAKVVPNVKRETLQNEILKNIHHGSAVYTDQAGCHSFYIVVLLQVCLCQWMLLI
jgi:ISXO2-like transposase domain